MIDNYYIYIYLDSRKSGRYYYKDICFLYEPIYIGKGKGKRYKEISYTRRSKLFKNKINKIKKSGLEPIVFKLYENLSEFKSSNFEKKLIREIGRIDLKTGTLLNMTDGGEGMSGHVVSEETRNKKSKKLKGRPLLEETKNKMSKNHVNVRGENNPFHKLKENEVWLIKKILNSDYYKSKKITQEFIGKMFNVDQITISNIKTGRTWFNIKLGEING